MQKASIVRRRSLALLFLAVFVVFEISHVSVAAAEGFYLYGVAESFTWKEFDDSGARVVKESGPLFGIGIAYSHEFEDQLTFTPKGEIFFGSVDYDGQTQTGEPLTTTVGYFGLTLDGDIGRKFKVSQSFSLEPFGGLGLRWWLRDIKNGTTSTGAISQGYMEGWTTLYGRLGVRGGIDVSKQTMMFFEGGVKLPFYNENTAYWSNIGGQDLTFHPGKQSSPFAEIGMKVNRVKASLFYDSMRFTKSNVITDVITTSEAVIIHQYWQPKSTADIYGVKIGASF
ncbi:MAG TPA: hypothetical protein VL087_06005 [Nitrospirota bacterium]|nr:hypothetical protein [Nitrospirota bacterium]